MDEKWLQVWEIGRDMAARSFSRFLGCPETPKSVPKLVKLKQNMYSEACEAYFGPRKVPWGVRLRSTQGSGSIGEKYASKFRRPGDALRQILQKLREDPDRLPRSTREAPGRSRWPTCTSEPVKLPNIAKAQLLFSIFLAPGRLPGGSREAPGGPPEASEMPPGRPREAPGRRPASSGRHPEGQAGQHAHPNPSTCK